MKQPQQDGHDGQQHLSKKKRRVGAALSLDKFAKSGVSKYDKKFAMEKLKKEKLIRYSKLSKIRHKMEGQGALPASRQLVVRDAVGVPLNVMNVLPFPAWTPCQLIVNGLFML